ncbi:hypothetical protein [Helicovermis profundi]|uniref:Uncharacterized protein n=1 Tax=Helicovermis profundi TaxID=3065157 RepID=A0AAU9EM62_9FIRM|nr:hypothetical protein HLPR_06870 [Clostridia bacterium S502]
MLIKCEQCGVFFGGEEGDHLCENCKVIHTKKSGANIDKKEKFVIAKDLVYDNPGINPEGLRKLMEEIGVKITVKEIMSYVDDGRLSLSNMNLDGLCEMCGRKILSGRFCPSCKKQKEDQMTRRNKSIQKEAVSVKHIAMHTRKE